MSLNVVVKLVGLGEVFASVIRYFALKKLPYLATCTVRISC